MTFTVLGTDDEALKITVTDALGYAVSVVDNDTEYGTTITDDTQNNLQIVSLTTTSAYTDQDARNSISASGDLSYNSATGVISYTEPTNISTFTNDSNYATQTYVQTQVNNLIDGAPGALDTLNELAAAINDDADVYNTLNGLISTNATNIALKFDSADFNTTFDTRLATKDTDDVAEGSNLYYTTARHNTDFDTKLAAADTGDLSEGTNLYYTDARANSAIDTRVTGAFIDALDTVSDGGSY